MAPVAAAMKGATFLVALFTGAAESVAVLEIGPNLLGAITSIIGAVVLIVQLRIAAHVRDTKEIAKEGNRELRKHVEQEGPPNT